MEPSLRRDTYYRIPIITGLVGVLSGYALYLTYQEQFLKEKPWVFPTALGIAALTAWLIEWLRDVILHGIEHERSDAHPLTRALATFFTIALFELFVTAIHVWADKGRQVFDDFPDLMGSKAGQQWAMWNLGAAIAIWLLLGVLVALMLSREIPGPGDALRRSLRAGINRGAWAGIVIAPLFVLAFVLVVRLGFTLQWVSADYPGWAAKIGVSLVSNNAGSEVYKNPSLDSGLVMSSRRHTDDDYPRGNSLVASWLRGLSHRYDWFHHALLWLRPSFDWLGQRLEWFGPRLEVLDRLVHQHIGHDPPLLLIVIVGAMYAPTWILWLLLQLSPWMFWIALIASATLLFRMGLEFGRNWDGLREIFSLDNLLPACLVLGLTFGVFLPVCRGFYAAMEPLFRMSGFWELPLGAIVMWGLPAVLLGALVPLLRRPSQTPRNWCFVGYGAAALLVTASLASFAFSGHGSSSVQGGWTALGLAAVAALIGLLFQREILIETYWPIAALVVALGISGATSLSQDVFTFSKFAQNLQDVNTIKIADSPVNVAAKPPDEAKKPEDLKMEKVLQICITASLGFWLTMGLLASWSIYEHSDESLVSMRT